jgi:hypothetical protein
MGQNNQHNLSFVQPGKQTLRSRHPKDEVGAAEPDVIPQALENQDLRRERFYK